MKKGVEVGYTGFFSWPAVYCRIIGIEGNNLHVELAAGGEGWITAQEFTPLYLHGAGQDEISARGQA